MVTDSASQKFAFEVYQAFFIGVPVAAVLIDPETQIIKGWNPAATELYGYTQEEAIGNTLELILDPEIMKFTKHFDHVKSYAKRGGTPGVMGSRTGRLIKAKTKGRGNPEIRIHIFLVPTSEGMLIGSASTDITAESKMVADLDKTKQKLERTLEKAKGRNRDLHQQNETLIRAQMDADRQQNEFQIGSKKLHSQEKIIVLVLATIAGALILPFIISTQTYIPSELLQLLQNAVVFIVGAFTSILLKFFDVKDSGSNQQVNQTTNLSPPERYQEGGHVERSRSRSSRAIEDDDDDEGF